MPRDPNPAGLLKSILLARGNWQETVARSGLPHEVQQLVITVAKKSRLMQFEKNEVVEELVAHFVDGHRSGKSYSQLVASFGDPSVTAALIRRSKTRNRPMSIRIFRITGWFTLCITGIYLGIYAWFHAGHPNPNRDYIADFNQSIRELDQADTAWPIYRPLWTKYGLSPGGGFDETVFFHNKADGYRWECSIKPGDEGWDATVAKLQEIRDLLDGIRVGAGRSSLGLELQADIARYSEADRAALFPNETADNEFVYADKEIDDAMKDAFIGILLPHVQSFREVARIFVVDTRLAIEQNDPDRTVENIDTIFGIARQATDCNLLVGSLVGYACSGIGFNLIEEVITEHPGFLDEQHLAAIQHTVESTDLRHFIKLEGEWMYVHDIAQRIFTNDGDGDGRMTPVGLKILEALQSYGAVAATDSGNSGISRDELYGMGNVVASANRIAARMATPASMFYLAGRRETLDRYDQYLDRFAEDLDRPHWESEISEIEAEIEKELEQQRFYVLSILAPAFKPVRLAMDRTIARQQGVIAALAIERFHMIHGEWPMSLDQLAPGLATRLPFDVINGRSLRFNIQDGAPIVYSVGNNGKDDGGKMANEEMFDFNDGRRPPHHDFGGSSSSAVDCDWILWPQLDWETRLLPEQE